MKKYVIVLILLLFSSFTIGQELRAYSLDAKKVYIDDVNARIEASPHTIYSSQWVNFTITTKDFTGDMNMVWGFNKDNIRPKQVQLYDPHTYNYTEEHRHLLVNVTKRVEGKTKCQVGYDYNVHKESIIERLNGEDVTTTYCYDYSIEITKDEEQIVYFENKQEQRYWTDINTPSKITEKLQANDKWYKAPSLSFTKDNQILVRAYIDVPFKQGHNTGKYDFGVYPSTYGDNIKQAYVDGKLFQLDPWWNTTFKRRKNITITNAGSTELTNFPAYIKIAKEGEMQADYDDLRFYSNYCDHASEGNNLDYDVVDYDGSYVELYVQIPTFTTGSKTICMYYGNDGASSGENAEDTWSSDYEAVYHLDDSSGNAFDETRNDNNGVVSGTLAYQQTGIVGDSVLWNSDSDYFNIDSTIAEMNMNEGTYEMWLCRNFADSINNDKNIIGYRRASTDNVELWYEEQDDTWHLKHKGGGTTCETNPAASYIPNGKCVHFAFVYSDSGNFVKSYVNGTATTTACAGTFGGTPTDAKLGTHPSTVTLEWLGNMDEVFLQSDPRSADWILQSYSLGGEQGDHVTFGAEEDTLNISMVEITINLPSNKTYFSDIVLMNITTNELANITYVLNGGSETVLCEDCDLNWTNISGQVGLNELNVTAVNSYNQSDVASKLFNFTVSWNLTLDTQEEWTDMQESVSNLTVTDGILEITSNTYGVYTSSLRTLKTSNLFNEVRMEQPEDWFPTMVSTDTWAKADGRTDPVLFIDYSQEYLYELVVATGNEGGNVLKYYHCKEDCGERNNWILVDGNIGDSPSGTAYNWGRKVGDTYYLFKTVSDTWTDVYTGTNLSTLTNRTRLEETDCGGFYDADTTLWHMYCEDTGVGAQPTAWSLNHLTAYNATDANNWTEVGIAFNATDLGWHTGDPDLMRIGDKYYMFVDKSDTHPTYEIAMLTGDTPDSFEFQRVVTTVNGGDLCIRWFPTENRFIGFTEYTGAGKDVLGIWNATRIWNDTVDVWVGLDTTNNSVVDTNTGWMNIENNYKNTSQMDRWHNNMNSTFSLGESYGQQVKIRLVTEQVPRMDVFTLGVLGTTTTTTTTTTTLPPVIISLTVDEEAKVWNSWWDFNVTVLQGEFNLSHVTLQRNWTGPAWAWQNTTSAVNGSNLMRIGGLACDSYNCSIGIRAFVNDTEGSLNYSSNIIGLVLMASPPTQSITMSCSIDHPFKTQYSLGTVDSPLFNTTVQINDNQNTLDKMWIEYQNTDSIHAWNESFVSGVNGTSKLEGFINGSGWGQWQFDRPWNITLHANTTLGVENESYCGLFYAPLVQRSYPADAAYNIFNDVIMNNTLWEINTDGKTYNMSLYNESGDLLNITTNMSFTYYLEGRIYYTYNWTDLINNTQYKYRWGVSSDGFEHNSSEYSFYTIYDPGTDTDDTGGSCLTQKGYEYNEIVSFGASSWSFNFTGIPIVRHNLSNVLSSHSMGLLDNYTAYIDTSGDRNVTIWIGGDNINNLHSLSTGTPTWNSQLVMSNFSLKNKFYSIDLEYENDSSEWYPTLASVTSQTLTVLCNEYAPDTINLYNLNKTHLYVATKEIPIFHSEASGYIDRKYQPFTNSEDFTIFNLDNNDVINTVDFYLEDYTGDFSDSYLMIYRNINATLEKVWQQQWYHVQVDGVDLENNTYYQFVLYTPDETRIIAWKKPITYDDITISVRDILYDDATDYYEGLSLGFTTDYDAASVGVAWNVSTGNLNNISFYVYNYTDNGYQSVYNTVDSTGDVGSITFVVSDQNQTYYLIATASTTEYGDVTIREIVNLASGLNIKPKAGTYNLPTTIVGVEREKIYTGASIFLTTMAAMSFGPISIGTGAIITTATAGMCKYLGWFPQASWPILSLLMTVSILYKLSERRVRG